MEGLKRIKANTVEKRLLTSKGTPNFGISFYALNRKGEYAAVSMYNDASFAVCTENGPQTLRCEPLLPRVRRHWSLQLPLPNDPVAAAVAALAGASHSPR